MTGKARHLDPGERRGFTLVELLMVLVIVGVLAVLALPKFFDRSAFEERGFFDETLTAVRYAHKLARASGCDVRVTLNASGFALSRRAGGCRSGPFTVSVGHPARPGSFSSSVPGGVVVAPAVDFYFDRLGRPRDTGGTLIGSVTSIAIGSLGLAVEPETGFAHES